MRALRRRCVIPPKGEEPSSCSGARISIKRMVLVVDLDSFLVSLYVLVDDWRQRRDVAPRKPGRPVLLSESEVLTLAILAQWPRWRSERDFWRFASSHLRGYFPTLCSQSQIGRASCRERV